MPEYGLGFWQCKLRYYNQEQLLNVAREYKKRGLPLDVIVCDFFHWPKCGDFRFDEEFFPDPAAMARELKELGVELMVSVWPLIDFESESYGEMKAKGLVIRPEAGTDISMRMGGVSSGLFYDATNPEAREYVWRKCRENYYRYGIRSFWLDVAEPEYSVYDFDNYRYRAGSNLETGNIYPREYARGFYEGLTGDGEETAVNLVRAAWVGSQRYGALVWSGDIHSTWEDFRRQIYAGLHMGIAGIPWWTTDIGGFSGGDPKDDDFRELLIRWFQYGTFCPVTRMHGDRLPHTELTCPDGRFCLGTGGDNEIWSFGGEAYEILKKYVNIREIMRPYTRGLMRQAHEKGLPVIRAMFYEFPNDEKCWETKEQYMFGNKILVAPICEKGAVKRDVWLPKGANWTDFNSGELYKGGQTVTIDAPVSVIPVFLRDNFNLYTL
jgi:alpha-D-xyloside xylohydrolase